MATESKATEGRTGQNNPAEKAKERIVLLLEPIEEERKRCHSFISDQSPLYDVETAASGKEALDLFATRSYDAVVMSY